MLNAEVIQHFSLTKGTKKNRGKGNKQCKAIICDGMSKRGNNLWSKNNFEKQDSLENR
jgi:hypothetical protein